MRTVGFILVGIKEDEMKFVGEDQASGVISSLVNICHLLKSSMNTALVKKEIDFWSEQAHNYLQGFKLEVKRLYIY